MNNYELKYFSPDTELAKAAAEQWLDLVAEAARAMQPHLVALSGGRIAKALFTQIVQQSKARGLSLAHVHFFWADERCLPPDNVESNFKLANETLFQPLGIATDKIHRLKGELSQDAAVAQANLDITQVAPRNASGLPVLDVVFLGMGEDGHVASLFPHAPAAIESSSAPYLAIADSPKPPPQRITLSYAVIAAAKQVWALANGAGKESALRDSLAPTGYASLGKVIRSRTHTVVFTDIKL